MIGRVRGTTWGEPVAGAALHGTTGFLGSTGFLGDGWTHRHAGHRDVTGYVSTQKNTPQPWHDENSVPSLLGFHSSTVSVMTSEPDA
jgi:hypothetical protein